MDFMAAVTTRISILGTSEDWVSQRLYRIKLKLKTMVDGYDEQ